MVIADPWCWKSENINEILDVYINPKIAQKSQDEVLCWESCLSDPQKMSLVMRPSKIDFEYYDLSGSYFLREANGLFGRVIQHEIDHLDGICCDSKAIKFQDIKPLEENADTYMKWMKENMQYFLE